MSYSTEQHFTLKQLAEKLGCSYTRARRLSLAEKGTLRIPSGSGKRSMTRVPAAVIERILRKYAVNLPAA